MTMLNEKERNAIEFLLDRYFGKAPDKKYEIQDKRILVKDFLPFDLIKDLNDVHNNLSVQATFKNSPLYRQGYVLIVKYQFD